MNRPRALNPKLVFGFAAFLLIYLSFWYSPVPARKARFPTVPPPTSLDRILIGAPHIDDEAIGAAGFISDAVEAGAQVFIVYLTSGDGNRFSAAVLDHTIRPRRRDLLREGRIRMREAVEAMSILGIPPDHLFFLGYPDGGLQDILAHPGMLYVSRRTGESTVPYPEALSPGAPYRAGNLRRDFLWVFCRVHPTIVIAPITFDAHPDHRAAGLLTRETISGLEPRVRLMGYLVHFHGYPRPFAPTPHHPLLPPPQFLSSSWSMYSLSAKALQRKEIALRAYRSQRDSPFLLALLDSFIKKNELFLDEPLPEGTEGERLHCTRSTLG
ncbi:MAG: PIG-L family deacetylase [Armatimonadota bacterium]|nr:PIG-L family deacetylase [Armatimonadota bacterium]MDR5704385.1 PIG-L family deacetylase [Armatimonadota bacterium]